MVVAVLPIQKIVLAALGLVAHVAGTAALELASYLL